MIRIMRCLVRNISEEGLAVAAVRLDIADDFVGVGLGGVIVFGQPLEYWPSSVNVDKGVAAVKLSMSQ